MAEQGNFKCLRCGHEYQDKFTAGVPQERSCPKCGSNSVRRIEEKNTAQKTS
jgi:predicted  nucleic acid-binding Zn-ribbon protein